jgi:hypothetical protein
MPPLVPAPQNQNKKKKRKQKKGGKRKRIFPAEPAVIFSKDDVDFMDMNENPLRTGKGVSGVSPPKLSFAVYPDENSEPVLGVVLTASGSFLGSTDLSGVFMPAQPYYNSANNVMEVHHGNALTGTPTTSAGYPARETVLIDAFMIAGADVRVTALGLRVIATSADDDNSGTLTPVLTKKLGRTAAATWVSYADFATNFTTGNVGYSVQEGCTVRMPLDAKCEFYNPRQYQYEAGGETIEDVYYPCIIFEGLSTGTVLHFTFTKYMEIKLPTNASPFALHKAPISPNLNVMRTALSSENAWHTSGNTFSSDVRRILKRGVRIGKKVYKAANTAINVGKVLALF